MFILYVKSRYKYKLLKLSFEIKQYIYHDLWYFSIQF